jgi:hypothetical protein
MRKEAKKGSILSARKGSETDPISLHFAPKRKNFYIETCAPNTSNHHFIHEIYSTQYILVYTLWLYVHIYREAWREWEGKG